MSDRERRANGERDEVDEIDTGEPIAELRELGIPVSRGFRARLRRRLERRQLATQAVDLGWGGLFEVIREWLEALFGALDPKAEGSEGSTPVRSETKRSSSGGAPGGGASDSE